MTLVKKKGSALTKLVDDSRVPAFLARGFEVVVQAAPAEDALDKMTVEELRIYAEAHGIELPNGKKADLLEAIREAT